MTINESVLTEYAQEHNLEFARDPYHASEGFEFRRYGRVIESIGFLFGENSIEVYRSRRDRAHDLIHRRLWLIESILTRLIGRKRDSYHVLQQLPLERFSEAEALAILKRYFKSASEED